jgi:aldose 1-epimerase
MHPSRPPETQGWPDAVNQPEFPSTILRPGEAYEHRVVHSFGLALDG